MKSKFLFFLSALVFMASPSPAQLVPKEKQPLIQTIELHQADLIKLSDEIWAFAETALAETKSATLLADYAEKKVLKLSVALPVCPLLLLPAMDRDCLL
ncbi:MAG: hypothetical protein ACXWWC_14845 [Chitinophagaceae bacterium]